MCTLPAMGDGGANNQAVLICAGFRYKADAKASSVGFEYEVSPTLQAEQIHSVVYCLQGNGIDRADTSGCNGRGWSENVCYTLNTIDRTAVVYDARGNGDGQTLTGDHENRVTDYTAVICMATGQAGAEIAEDLSPTLTCNHEQPIITAAQRHCKYIVRRLTPLECERLQGYPDGWTDIGAWTDGSGKPRKTSDSARYKALGNSIALPPWRYVLSRLNTYCTEHTMASLFDGISGFPLIWQELNGPGMCLWSSEIEPFAIAVTTRRLGKLSEKNEDQLDIFEELEEDDP